MSGPPMGVGGQMSGAQMGGPPMMGGMSAGMRDNDGGSGGGGGGDVGMDLGAVLQLLGDVAAATQQGPPHNMGAPPMARGDDRGPGGWEDRGRDGPPGMGMHGSGGPAQIGFPPGRGPGGFPPMPAGFPQGMPPHMGNGPPREVTLFCPGHLTGSIIGKQGAVIKGLRQEAGEMQCVIDLKQAPRPPEGDGSAKIIISGAHGNDVMVRARARPCVLTTCICMYVSMCVHRLVRALVCSHAGIAALCPAPARPHVQDNHRDDTQTNN